MKVCVFSDSHGYAGTMMEAVELEKPDACVFLGDGERDLAALEDRWPELPVYAVRGNCDFRSERDNAVCCELEGVTDLVFDFKQLAYITSAGLRALLTAYRVLRGKGKITVVNANEMVLEVLELTGFRAILSIE